MFYKHLENWIKTLKWSLFIPLSKFKSWTFFKHSFDSSTVRKRICMLGLSLVHIECFLVSSYGVAIYKTGICDRLAWKLSWMLSTSSSVKIQKNNKCSNLVAIMITRTLLYVINYPQHLSLSFSTKSKFFFRENVLKKTRTFQQVKFWAIACILFGYWIRHKGPPHLSIWWFFRSKDES